MMFIDMDVFMCKKIYKFINMEGCIWKISFFGWVGGGGGQKQNARTDSCTYKILHNL
jgi:hypothetical protein